MNNRPATNQPLSLVDESMSILDLLKYVSFDSSFIPDLDNTLMEPTIELGSDQWFEHMFKHGKNQIANGSEAGHAVLTLYHNVQHFLHMQPVEKVTVWLIRTLQEIGLPMIPLTARSECLIQTTQRQLKAMGIDFSQQKHGIPGRMEIHRDTDGTISVYQDGIIFCNGQNKGKTLEAFIRQCIEKKYMVMPAHFVMFDDKAKHLETVRLAAKNLGVDFHGLRYGVLDEKVKSIDMEKAHAQLAELKDKLEPETQQAIARLNMPAGSRVVAEPTKFYIAEEKEGEERPAKRRRLFFSTVNHLKRSTSVDGLGDQAPAAKRSPGL